MAVFIVFEVSVVQVAYLSMIHTQAKSTSGILLGFARAVLIYMLRLRRGRAHPLYNFGFWGYSLDEAILKSCYVAGPLICGYMCCWTVALPIESGSPPDGEIRGSPPVAV